jgi:hypothetical protein
METNNERRGAAMTERDGSTIEDMLSRIAERNQMAQANLIKELEKYLNGINKAKYFSIKKSGGRRCIASPTREPKVYRYSKIHLSIFRWITILDESNKLLIFIKLYFVDEDRNTGNHHTRFGEIQFEKISTRHIDWDWARRHQKIGSDFKDCAKLQAISPNSKFPMYTNEYFEVDNEYFEVDNEGRTKDDPKCIKKSLREITVDHLIDGVKNDDGEIIATRDECCKIVVKELLKFIGYPEPAEEQHN